MNLGKLCKYARECNVYNDNNSRLKKPVYLMRNVFCNRGARGWNNCLRFARYESGKEVGEYVTPYG